MAAAASTIVFAKGGLRARVDAFFASLGKAMMTYAVARSRAAEIQALNDKTDAELAQLGIARDDIPRYVFRDMFYV